MKNNKGFTLVELITVIAIIAVFTSISVPLFSSLLSRFRTDYYKKLEQSIELAASNYVLDSRSQRLRNGESKNILLSEMSESFTGAVGSNGDGMYLSRVVDYKKQSCDEESYVHVSKKNNKYTYKVCLSCPQDGYVSSDCDF